MECSHGVGSCIGDQKSKTLFRTRDCEIIRILRQRWAVAKKGAASDTTGTPILVFAADGEQWLIFDWSIFDDGSAWFAHYFTPG